MSILRDKCTRGKRVKKVDHTGGQCGSSNDERSGRDHIHIYCTTCHPGCDWVDRRKRPRAKKDEA